MDRRIDYTGLTTEEILAINSVLARDIDLQARDKVNYSIKN